MSTTSCPSTPVTNDVSYTDIVWKTPTRSPPPSPNKGSASLIQNQDTLGSPTPCPQSPSAGPLPQGQSDKETHCKYQPVSPVTIIKIVESLKKHSAPPGPNMSQPAGPPGAPLNDNASDTSKKTRQKKSVTSDAPSSTRVTQSKSKEGLPPVALPLLMNPLAPVPEESSQSKEKGKAKEKDLTPPLSPASAAMNPIEGSNNEDFFTDATETLAKWKDPITPLTVHTMMTKKRGISTVQSP
ncbi:hypothetical protein GYMLUDRAFT_246467 [Collybiopsis luxurians FD-317 M1]|uniref:Uncharacterized protein n=1 Tax=Collybiopsis luxurians FD-317 M1 TaxID=944289 RepID=A0A0D0CRB3_9AGAR|nr:hypothetical protein GYMLUDRAFT_246467 [Collybiopsis luxurians FD-317 M1]